MVTMLLIVFSALIRIFSNSFLGVYQKKLSNSFSSNFINFLSYSILFFVVLAFVPVFNSVLSINFSSENSLNLIYFAFLTGLMGAIGNAFQIKALKLGELSILAPINSYKIIFSIIFSFLILREIPSISALAGIVLIIFGSYFIFETTKEGFSFLLLKRKDMQFRIFAVLFTGLEAIFIKKMILLSNSLLALLLWALSTAVFSFFFLLFDKKKFAFSKLDLNSWKMFFFLIVSLGVMQFSTNILFKLINVSYALSLFQLSSVLSVVLGYKFFKEKNFIKKLIGSLIMVFGAIVIILFNG